MLNYIYTIAKATGTTGFAVCEPDPAPDFEQGLALLAQRPLDAFLHRHMLKRLLDASPGFWPALADACLADRQKSTAALLLEAAQIAPSKQTSLATWLPDLRNLATPWHEATPLAILAAPPAHDADAIAFYKNIHQHAPLPALQTHEKIKAAAAGLANVRGILQKLHASFTPTRVDENIPDPARVHAVASAALAAAGIAEDQEMRHEASLSPIALLRSWRLSASLPASRNAHTLTGTTTAYGRGLKLAQARAACNMEIIERACAHAMATDDGACGKIGAHKLIRASYAQLAQDAAPAISPGSLLAPEADSQFFAELDAIPLHWLPGRTAAGQEILVPAQAVYLFSNLDEVCIFDAIGSTGLAAGASMSMAKLAALGEVLERDAHATTPFEGSSCFELQSRDAAIQGLLDDYRWRGIHVQFQDISNEFGFPAYRAFVKARDGSIAQATGAGLSGPRAAIAALTETPWPYSWAQATRKSPSDKGIAHLPKRMLEDLPDYSLDSFADSLALLEKTLAACGHEPVYVDISRPDLPFPVCRAFIPGLAIDPELEAGPSLRLLARLNMRKNQDAQAEQT